MPDTVRVRKKMKTVVFLAALVALAAAGHVSNHEVATKQVDGKYVERQIKVFSLLETIGQERVDADWWKVGLEYDVKANIQNYTNRKAVEEFLLYFRSGFMPKHKTFSVFYDRMREEAIALFKLFFYAKDFETFYQTAAFARVHFNDGQFLYAYYVAVSQRPDTRYMVLPAPYEMFPQYFVNTDTFLKAYRVKMQNGLFEPQTAQYYGIVKEHDDYVFYSNYSSSWLSGSEEQRLSYFTEDIGMNSYYYFFQTLYPFWFNEGLFVDFKEYRGELLYFNYQQLIARYYLERLTNGLGEIPDFSWYQPIDTGYVCQLSTYYPFFQRNDYFTIDHAEKAQYMQFIINHEQSFQFFLEHGQHKMYNQDVDFHKADAMNFIGNYWFTNNGLYEKAGPRNYERYYDIAGLHVLSGVPEPVDEYTVFPSALELYQTSLRDPVFYQFYKRILNNIVEYKRYLGPYDYNHLFFEGVNIKKVNVDKLVTYFDFYDFEISNDIFYSPKESHHAAGFKVRQPRLNHQPFTVNVEIESHVAKDVIVKFFLGPKYDGNGYPLRIEDNWMNFVELDWFQTKLTSGQNKITRQSHEFLLYRDDSLPVSDVVKMLGQGKIPLDMSENFFFKPDRMMLPRGTEGGFPFQFYVVIYPTSPLPQALEQYAKYLPDSKPLAYPFDRPVYEEYFSVPNIYHTDVMIYHEGEYYANHYNVKGYYKH